MAEKQRIINLLPNKENVLNQFLSWALTIGRLLVIITETLALSVFIYRFSIDMRLVDLHDKIKTTSIIVSNFKDGEDNYRDLHARLAFAREYDDSSDKTLKVLKDVVEMGRGRITFKNLLVTTNSIEIEAQASSVASLSLFTTTLKNYPEVTKVSVNRVENRTSSAQVTIGISADLKTN
jgi:hypothetical protein